jgi:hypothetical protein
VGRGVAEVPEHARFRSCTERHGLGLHRIHLLSPGSGGSVQATLVLDCVCGLRWLLRVNHGEVVGVERAVLDRLRQGREGQVTAPPGFAGAPRVAGRGVSSARLAPPGERPARARQP